jgi:FKBP-type peptidyl-prolyl cis-trans isomerase
MLRNWTRQLVALLQNSDLHKARRRTNVSRRLSDSPIPAAISRLEVLEPRRLLTNLVSVNVAGNSISLKDVNSWHSSSGDVIDVSYTSTQVTLTGENGTMLQVGSQSLSTYTVNITGPASVSMQLGHHSNTVTVTGDGTSSLSSLDVNLGRGRQSSSLTLNQVIVGSVSVTGGRWENGGDVVTLNQCTVNGNLDANLGRSSNGKLDLESTKVTGNLTDQVGDLVINQSTISGSFSDRQRARNGTFTSTDSTYQGTASIRMGANGTVNFVCSTNGPNHFESSVSISGSYCHGTTINEPQNSVVFDVAPNLHHATVSSATDNLSAPTVNSATVSTTDAPVVTGTFDAANSASFSVTMNGQTYTLGTNSQLTSPSTNEWSLNVGSAFTSTSTTVTASSVDKLGAEKSATGTITLTGQAASIINYVSNNALTPTVTADGLNYVVTTKGTGAVPTKGQTVSVNYSGYILNSNGTKGTEFDSNTDAAFGHVTPFSFQLGAGQVIAGWDEAFSLLPVGTVAELIIPSDLAYGTSGSGSIPGNSILIFDITVLSVT